MFPASGWRGALAALLLAATFLAWAAPASAEARRDDRAQIEERVLTGAFLAAHPDLRWRGVALEAWNNRDHALALRMFLRAARYADKPSQAAIADMYWRGEGVPQDRPLGYAWMDLAAERMYPVFLGYRERYWADLSPAEREEAIERGRGVLAEYGDNAAKPRLERVLRRGAQVTGSRTGYVNTLTIIPNSGPLAGTGMTLRSDEYYAAKYWEPAQYWQLQDAIWRAPPRGKVDVGDIEQVSGAQP